MDPERLTAWSLAHKALLAYVLKVLHQMAPTEAGVPALEETAMMLQQSISRMLEAVPADQALRIQVMADTEIDDILMARVAPKKENPA